MPPVWTCRTTEPTDPDVQPDADLRVEQVPLASTTELRQRVLRPDSPPDPSTWAALGVPEAATFAVFAGCSEAAISTVTVMPEPCPWQPSADRPWRLRGMATEDALRGRGAGRLALDAAVDHVVAQGADLLWCNARVAARRFYERAAFVVEGEAFDVTGIGLHLPMDRRLSEESPL